jgi:putative transposase
LLRKLIRKQARAPRVLITDKLGSYGAARKKMSMKFERRQRKGLNNRADNSGPTGRRERTMKQFKSGRRLRPFVSIHDPIANLFSFSPQLPERNRASHASIRGYGVAASHCLQRRRRMTITV